MLLWIRDETKPGERRTPLVPRDALRLLQRGISVTVERSTTRCFCDEEYEDIGAKMVPSGSWKHAPLDAIILGLKELPDEDTPLEHTHLFFGHCYKGQYGATKLLERFRQGEGRLWDLEYLVDDSGKRLVSFGKIAGQVGLCVGLLASISKRKAEPTVTRLYLTQYNTLRELQDSSRLKVLVIGANGRCGQGACEVANELGLSVTTQCRGDPPLNMTQFDLILNCILLTDPIPPFELDLSHPCVLVDISCDVSHPSHPFPFYRETTTIENPVRKYGEVSVIAIDHLPSIVPYDASVDFSRQLLPYLEELADPLLPLIFQRVDDLFSSCTDIV